MGARNSTNTTSNQLVTVESGVERADSDDREAKIRGLTRLITAQNRRNKDITKDQYDYTKVRDAI